MVPHNITLEEELVIKNTNAQPHDLIFLVDLDGNILSWSKGAEKTTGYSENEISGENFSIFFPEGERKQKVPEHSIEKAVKQGFYESIGWRLRKNGEKYRASEIITHLTGENLKNRLLVLIREIDDEGLFKGWKYVFENSDWAFAISSPETKKFEMVNPALANLYGYTVKEMIGQPIAMVLDIHSQAKLGKHINTIKQKGHTVYESTHVRRDGTNFPVIIDASALRDYSGKVIYNLVNVRDISELKEIEKSSRLNEEKFKHLFDEASDGIFIADLNGRYTNVNDSGCKMLGFTKEEIIGKTIVDLISASDIKRLEKSREMLLKTGQFQIEEWKLKKKDNSFLPVEISTKILPNGEWVAFVRDIAERKKTQEILKQSEEKFRGLLEISHDTIIIVNKHGIIEFVNNQFKNKFGYTPEEIIGKSVETLIPERFGVKHVIARMKYMTDPVARTMGLGANLKAKRKDGSEFPVDISLVPFVMTGGMVYTAFVRDLSDRKRFDAQQRFLAETSRVLSENIEFEKRLINLTQLCVPFLCDFCLLYLSDKKKLLPKSVLHRDKTKEKLLKDIAAHLFSKPKISPFSATDNATNIPPLLIEHVTDSFLESITDGKEYVEKIKELQAASLLFVPLISGEKVVGSLILGMSTSNRIFSEEDISFNSTIGYRIGLSIDNINLYIEAQKATKAREDILSIVSHDLRNPLSAIKSGLQLIPQLVAQDKKEKIDTLIATLNTSTIFMERLINDLLDFSKIQEETLSLMAGKISLKQLAEETLESIRLKANEKSVELSCDVPASDSIITCDPMRIKQVLNNLLGNALKFTPANGKVRLTIKDEKEKVYFSVTDTGPGISGENIQHIFDRYWQEQKTAFLGSGLGLFIANGIIKAHGGKIWVESELEKGSNFQFEIPKNKLAADETR